MGFARLIGLIVEREEVGVRVRMQRSFAMALGVLAVCVLSAGEGRAAFTFDTPGPHLITTSGNAPTGPNDDIEATIVRGSAVVTFDGSDYNVLEEDIVGEEPGAPNPVGNESLVVIENGSVVIDALDLIFFDDVSICPDPFGLGQDPGAGCFASVTLREGTVFTDVEVFRDGSFTIEGGVIQEELLLFDNAVLNFLGGETFADTESGRSPFSASGTSTVNLFDGIIGDDLDFFEESTGFIRGGTIGSSGPLENGLRLNEDSTVTIFGSSFMLDGTPVAGELGGAEAALAAACDTNDVASTCPILTATLQNGDALNVHLFKASTATLLLIPEPSTAMLLAAGLSGLALRGRRR